MILASMSGKTSTVQPGMASSWAGPPRGLALLLLALVLLAHGLALTGGALHFAPGNASAGTAQTLPPMQVRRIDSLVPETPQKTPENTQKADFQASKPPLAQQIPARAAINLGAKKELQNDPQDEPQTAPEPTAEEKAALQEYQQAMQDRLDNLTAAVPTGPPQVVASADGAPAQALPEAPLPMVALPASARLDYKVEGQAKGLNYYATAEFDWKSNGAAYEARMTVKAFMVGQRSMESAGAVTAQGLAPLKFSDKYRSEQAAHFEESKGLITFSANTPPKPWQPGAQDRVSVFMQLAGLLAGNPQPNTVFTLYTASARDAEDWTFTLGAAPEALLLPYGPLSAWRLLRQPRREYDQKVEVWFAPALGFMPVRIRITQANGDFVDQKLSTLALAGG